MTHTQGHMMDLTPILDAPGESLVLEDRLALESFSVGDITYAVVEPIEYTMAASHTGDGILLSGPVRATLRTDCSRCLNAFDLVLSGEVSVYFALDQRNVDTETSVALLPGPQLDIQPLILAALTEVAPFAPQCSKTCAGLCPHCGVDLNVEECGCSDDLSEDSPFAGLKGMFDDSGDGNQS